MIKTARGHRTASLSLEVLVRCHNDSERWPYRRLPDRHHNKNPSAASKPAQCRACGELCTRGPGAGSRTSARSSSGSTQGTRMGDLTHVDDLYELMCIKPVQPRAVDNPRVCPPFMDCRSSASCSSCSFLSVMPHGRTDFGAGNANPSGSTGSRRVDARNARRCARTRTRPRSWIRLPARGHDPPKADTSHSQ